MLILILLNNIKNLLHLLLAGAGRSEKTTTFTLRIDIFANNAILFLSLFDYFQSQDPFSPGKQELFSPPPLERFEPPQPQQPQQAQPASNGGNVVPQPQPAPTRNGLQNGFNGFVSSKVRDDQSLPSLSGLSTIDI